MIFLTLHLINNTSVILLSTYAAQKATTTKKKNPENKKTNSKETSLQTRVFSKIPLTSNSVGSLNIAESAWFMYSPSAETDASSSSLLPFPPRSSFSICRIIQFLN